MRDATKIPSDFAVLRYSASFGCRFNRRVCATADSQTIRYFWESIGGFVSQLLMLINLYRTVCFLTCGPTRVGFVWQVVAATFWVIGNYRTSPWANRKHLLASFRRNSWIIQCFKHQRDSATVFAFCSPHHSSRPEHWRTTAAFIFPSGLLSNGP